MEENLEFHIKVSYFEIYMDKIRDLLDGKYRFTLIKAICLFVYFYELILYFVRSVESQPQCSWGQK